MPSIHSSLLYNETRVISDLFEVNLRQKDDEGWFSEQFRICPGCSSVIRYVKEASDIEEFTSDVEFLFDEFDWVTDTKNWEPESYSRRDASIRMLHPLLPENIELTTIDDFNQHVSGCYQEFSVFLHEDGIIEINDSDKKYAKRIPDLMCYLSKKENGYHWNTDGLWDDDSMIPVSSFVLFESNIPVAYCAVSEYYAFSKNDDIDDGLPEWIVSYSPRNKEGQIYFESMLSKSISDRYISHGSKWVIHELYTFPEYRNQGFAGRILNYLRDERGLDTENLLITEPLSTQSKGLIARFSSRNVVCLAGEDSKSAAYELALSGTSHPRQEFLP